MAELTPLAISVLALLEEKPMHAYEMYQLLITRKNDRIVKVRPGSLYHTVERLAGQEYVRATGTERAGNRPERTTYEITPAGSDALIRRVERGLENYAYEYPTFPVLLSEAHNLKADDAVLRLRSRVDDLDTLLADVDATLGKATEVDVPEVYLIGGLFMRHQLAAERDWLATTIERIESKDLAWQPREKQ
ncbi:PadR family transcriptional regulator [Kribbella solani]|uniref:DNA-binding PadR family transcriptional regulator n=1 Tax=Kribbella solani TaxID=236067 RepID=A0A841E0Q3_9ACTN|nr:PadR family transcriptional regulator [Kribbella solani]MBB5982616.1 DNA-binding PadR family transcriptional regulator [Kribbella solani]MDX2970925.1 PadR family transcriptional regulator [Kribbella solani]MDX3001087.1 PadR family transcriptional regulator [Kribbella solani]